MPKLIAALVLALAMVLSMSPLTAQADEVDLTPGPTIIADPDSPTGYTGHFVYYNPTATSVRFVADILLRDWDNPTSPTVYQPSQYRPGLMRGGGAYDVQMTNAGNGYWVTDVPLAAGPNQYWFYVNNNTNPWVADPANPPLYAPDGLTGNARRAFNAVYVPYDAEKQNYAPLAERVIANPRPDSPKGTWSYVPIQIGTASRTLGVYLPPGYDAEPRRAVQDDLPAARQRPGPVRLDEHRQRPDHHGQPAAGRPHRTRGRRHDELPVHGCVAVQQPDEHHRPVRRDRTTTSRRSGWIGRSPGFPWARR